MNPEQRLIALSSFHRSLTRALRDGGKDSTRAKLIRVSREMRNLRANR